MWIAFVIIAALLPWVMYVIAYLSFTEALVLSVWVPCGAAGFRYLLKP
jgi:hypothetical protein